MALIRDALSVLPARPAVLAAPVIVVVVLSLYYWDLREKCVDIRDTRQAFHDHLRSLGSGERFRLADFFEFDWNKVRIVARVQPGTISDECLLDWNWAGEERESLIESGRLSVLIFGHRGSVVGYYELHRDQIAFDEIESQLTPETAEFRIDHAAESDAITLSTIPRDG